MDEFQNKISSQGIHYSRYIASWLEAVDTFKLNNTCRRIFMRAWLHSIGLDENEVREIYYLATNGKLELESSAKEFIRINRVDLE